jgi:D-alanyl-D-alanine carboxypeptidase/D-alanyl-D-alanine-endopeptidase (penicillin-binding protein 4)
LNAPRHLRRSPGYLLPSLLALTAIAGGAVALQIEHTRVPQTSDALVAPITPVLSARRVPDIVAAPVADRRLAARLTELLGQSPGATCLVVDADGHEVFAAQPTTPMTPASLLKLLTGATAIDKLGADTRLRTEVRANAPVAGGVVGGDLYLVGGGDPLLMTADYFAALKHPPAERSSLEALADSVVAAGVRSVNGNVIGDESRYDGVRYNPRWSAGIASEVSIGPMTALTVNGGLDEYPPSPDVHRPAPHPAPDPPAMAAERFAALLRERGVAIAGGPARATTPAGSVEIAHLDSSPVSALVQEMLRESDNTTAELLAKEMGVRSSASGTTDAGLAVVSQEIAALGLPTDGATMVDGSGLSTDNKVTCSAVQDLLDHTGPGGTLAAGLPVAAQTGTLEKRFTSQGVAGRLRAKTGTLNQVTALAGFLSTARGSGLTFTYILNLQRSRRITEDDIAMQDQLAAILDTYPEAPETAVLGPKPLP